MRDLKLTDDGDLVISSAGDLETVTGDKQLVQAIIFRLKTMKGDYTLTPTLGTSLEEFIGRQNNSATRLLIEESIKRTLTQDFSIVAITVKCVPLDGDEVFVLIEIPSVEDIDKVIQVSSTLDLKRGEVFPRIEHSIE